MKSNLPLIIYIIQLFRIFSTQSIDENQTNIEQFDDIARNSVVQLNFYLKEEKLPELICEILNTTDTNNITTGDIIQLGKIDQLTFEQIKIIINYYNLTIDQVFNVDNLEEILQFTGTSFVTFYNDLTRSLDIYGQTLRDTLNYLNIDTGRFFEALGLNSNDIYDILRNGTYNQTNIDNVLITINKSNEEIINTTRTIILSRITPLNRTYFMRNYGFNRRQFLQFWSILNITTQDVYNVENFRRILTNKLMDLNKFVIPGTVIDRDGLVVHRRLYEHFQSLDYDKFRVETNNNLEIVGFDQSITENIVELKLKHAIDVFVRKANEILSNNCFYIRIDGDTIIVDDLIIELNTTNSRIIGRKNSNTTFQLGAPLICSVNRELYGLAVEEDAASIQFESIVRSAFNSGSINIVVFIPLLIVQILLTIF